MKCRQMNSLLFFFLSFGATFFLFLSDCSAECIEGNCKNGNGIYIIRCSKYYTADGKYSGEWKNGQLDGKGVLAFPDGLVYSGMFKENMANGKGTVSYLNGVVYSGQFRDGRVVGKVRLKDHEGNVYTGMYEETRLIGVVTCKDNKKVKGWSGFCIEAVGEDSVTPEQQKPTNQQK